MNFGPVHSDTHSKIRLLIHSMRDAHLFVHPTMVLQFDENSMHEMQQTFTGARPNWKPISNSKNIHATKK